MVAIVWDCCPARISPSSSSSSPTSLARMGSGLLAASCCRRYLASSSCSGWLISSLSARTTRLEKRERRTTVREFILFCILDCAGCAVCWCGVSHHMLVFLLPCTDCSPGPGSTGGRGSAQLSSDIEISTSPHSLTGYSRVRPTADWVASGEISQGKEIFLSAVYFSQITPFNSGNRNINILILSCRIIYASSL